MSATLEWTPEAGPWLAEVMDELDLRGPVPDVARCEIEVDKGQRLSVLAWGDEPPQALFLHGGGQNAHTWDMVIAALGIPALAVDLPGHGHSGWRADGDYWPRRNARSVARVLDAVGVVRPIDVVGMSLGGLTSIRLAAQEPQRVRSLTVVDVTPSVHQRTPTLTQHQRGTTALIGGPSTFATLDEMVELAVRSSPGRAESAVRRGVVHNTHELPDGSWAWRYDRLGGPEDFSPLWEDVARIQAPAMLVRGGASSFVPDDDVEEFRRRLGALRAELVPGAGHSVQSDAPLQLAQLLRDHWPADL